MVKGAPSLPSAGGQSSGSLPHPSVLSWQSTRGHHVEGAQGKLPGALGASSRPGKAQPLGTSLPSLALLSTLGPGRMSVQAVVTVGGQGGRREGDPELPGPGQEGSDGR